MATALAVVAAAVPLGGLGWWLTADGSDDALARDAEQSVPVYMQQSSLLGQEHGVLVLGGSVDEGVTYRIRRDDGTTVGEDEILTLADEDAGLTSDVRDLVSAPTPAVVADLGARGVEYVVLSLARRRPDLVAARRDRRARAGQRRGPHAPAPGASTGRSTRRRSTAPARGGAPRCSSCRDWRSCVVLVLAAPTVRQRRREEGRDD